MKKCCICGKRIKGFGNNPYPLCKQEDYVSKCCDECDKLVVQSRIDMVVHKMDAKAVQKKYLGKEL